MYTYQIIKEDVLPHFMLEKFVDISQYDDFAKHNSGAFVHAFDFLKNCRILAYQDVLSDIQGNSENNFYIMWNLSQMFRNDNFESREYQLASIQKEDLIFMLEDQKADMQGEQLCYLKNVERSKFWDMFIINHAITWCYAITHEDNENGDRLCFYSHP